MHYVVDDSSNEEPSYVKVTNENGEVLVYLHGPMSMFAAGAFIGSQESESADCINLALDRWRD